MSMSQSMSQPDSTQTRPLPAVIGSRLAESPSDLEREVVALFEVRGVAAGVEEPVGGVEYPDGEGHGGYGGDWQSNATAMGDEPSPERGDRGCVEREEVP